MKKILSILVVFTMFVMTGLQAFADSAQEALNFFNSYVSAANSYSPTVAGMYSPSAKIIRQVVKPNGELVNVSTNTATYIKQMKIGQAGAKMRGYKNTYTNVSVTSLGNGAYKVSSLRQPKGETYKLKTYMIVKKINGECH
jgi:uroporphyrinogen-III decarboxylase